MSLIKPERPQCDGAAENQRSQQFWGKIEASRAFGEYLNAEKVWGDLEVLQATTG